MPAMPARQSAPLETASEPALILFDREPAQYRHWTLTVQDRTATLTLKTDEQGGLQPGYVLKLNSYDLGVDMEFHDALNRIRFEHPQVGCVVITSGLERMFCAGANIYMLGLSSHGWKVNFCKFTNETRNGLEDSSRHDGLKSLAAVNGTCAGGGYEIALACDRILMVDDRSSAVSLPEVPLLGVLPGTGGLTRVIDKRRVRRDRADWFCTSEEGLRAPRALEWGLVDAIAPPQGFSTAVASEVEALLQTSTRPADAKGIHLTPLAREMTPTQIRWSSLTVDLDPVARTATLTLKAPDMPVETDPQAMQAAGAAWWPLRFARELDDAILLLRTNWPEIGLWLIRSQGDAAAVQAADAALLGAQDHWLGRETLGLLRRCLARLDVTSRSLFALIEPGSCFTGSFLELALACDQIHMLSSEAADAPRIALDALNRGPLPMVNGLTRLETRFHGHPEQLSALPGDGEALDAAAAAAAGLVTFTPDEIDWEDEIRLAIESRASLSPDALTGMEASLRFAGPETMLTRVFARLSAWQNWIFNRPNAVGERGALRLFGTGSRPGFDWTRI